MTGTLKYRLVALALAVVFGVFNIGIPIIIASCPMAATMNENMCAMCHDQGNPATSKVTTENTLSCCATLILAERNTTELMQAKERAQELVLQISLVPGLSPVICKLSPASAVTQVSTSRSTVIDIPIFTTSLLI